MRTLHGGGSEIRPEPVALVPRDLVQGKKP